MFKSTKTKLIFVTIFSLVCIITTALLIMYNKIDVEDVQNDNETSLSTQTTEQNNTEQGIDLKGKYNQNDIEIIGKQSSQDKIEISYFQIEGLKNKTIQNKINKEIENITFNSYKEKINLSNVNNLSVSTSCTANYGNILSLNVYCWGRANQNIEGQNNDIIDIEKGMNFDLNTGNKIEFRQFFTNNAPMEDIIRKCAYNSILRDRAELTLSQEMVVNNYGNIEEDVAMVMEAYKRNKIDQFYCTTSE